MKPLKEINPFLCEKHLDKKDNFNPPYPWKDFTIRKDMDGEELVINRKDLEFGLLPDVDLPFVSGEKSSPLYHSFCWHAESHDKLYFRNQVLMKNGREVSNIPARLTLDALHYHIPEEKITYTDAFTGETKKFYNRPKLTWRDILAVENNDHRAWVIETVGWHDFAKHHKVTVMDINENPVKGALLASNVIDEGEPIHLLCAFDPASGPVPSSEDFKNFILDLARGVENNSINGYFFMDRANPRLKTAAEVQKDIDPLSDFHSGNFLIEL